MISQNASQHWKVERKASRWPRDLLGILLKFGSLGLWDTAFGQKKNIWILLKFWMGVNNQTCVSWSTPGDLLVLTRAGTWLTTIQVQQVALERQKWKSAQQCPAWIINHQYCENLSLRVSNLKIWPTSNHKRTTQGNRTVVIRLDPSPPKPTPWTVSFQPPNRWCIVECVCTAWIGWLATGSMEVLSNSACVAARWF